MAMDGLRIRRELAPDQTPNPTHAVLVRHPWALVAMVDDYVTGHALRSAAAAEIDLKFTNTQLATGGFPQLADVFGSGKIDASKDRFERGVLAILDAAGNGR
jgi:hypothetical protein